MSAQEAETKCRLLAERNEQALMESRAAAQKAQQKYNVRLGGVRDGPGRSVRVAVPWIRASHPCVHTIHRRRYDHWSSYGLPPAARAWLPTGALWRLSESCVGPRRPWRKSKPRTTPASRCD
eukprot:SAG25_NODE_596_length_6668_cov_212.169889_5_plen_122_part_00